MKAVVLALLLLCFFMATSEVKSERAPVRLCGRDFVRAVVFTCGGSRWRRQLYGFPNGLIESYGGHLTVHGHFEWLPTGIRVASLLKRREDSIFRSRVLTDSLLNITRKQEKHRKTWKRVWDHQPSQKMRKMVLRKIISRSQSPKAKNSSSPGLRLKEICKTSNKSLSIKGMRM